MLRNSYDLAVSSGIYHSNCHCRVELRVRKGDKFPECSTCKKPVSWSFTRSVYADPPPSPTPPLPPQPMPPDERPGERS